MKIIIDEQEYIASLENNPTVQAFLQILPQEFIMEELNSNEKYVYIDCHLPTKPSIPKQISAGDIMLYGDNCLVIFYKTFTTNYSYTKIGHINNLPKLGNHKLTVKFSQ